MVENGDAIAQLLGFAPLLLRAREHHSEIGHVIGIVPIEFHRPLRTTPPLEAAVAKVRAIVPRVEEDRVLSGELAELAGALRTGEVVL